MMKIAVAVALTAASIVPASAPAAPPTPFGHACTDENGVRFCPTTGLNYLRKSNWKFTVTVSKLSLSLPTRERKPA
jgi:hypothetical protein